VPADFDQRLVGRLFQVFGVIFVPVGLLAFVLAGLSPSRRMVVGVVFVGAVPLVGFLLCGLLWLILEWERRRCQREINIEHQAELAQLRAQAQRQRKAWEVELVTKQAEAQRLYDEQMQRWQAAVYAVQAEGQRQKTAWETDVAAKQADARRLYEEQVLRWQAVASPIQAAAERQEQAWQADLTERQAKAKQWYDEEIRRWQASVSVIEAERGKQETQWEADQAAKRAAAKQQYDEDMRRWQAAAGAIQAEKTRRRDAVLDLQRRMKAAEQHWTSVASDYRREFDTRKADVPRLRSNSNDVERRRAAELQERLSKAREAHFVAHLRQHLLRDAAISDIGSGRKRKLQAHGVNSAWDVSRDRIMRIKGFKAVLTENLIEWRRNVEATFIFKTGTAIAPDEMRALESTYELLREPIRQQLAALEMELEGLSEEAQKQLGQLTQQITTCLTQLAQAEADLAAIPKGL
jgi:hypothetical protein